MHFSQEVVGVTLRLELDQIHLLITISMDDYAKDGGPGEV